MKFTFLEFIDETFPIFGSAITVWMIMRFWAGASDIVALAFTAFAAFYSSSMLLPDMIKRARVKQHA
jgi:hypothetical protein